MVSEHSVYSDSQWISNDRTKFIQFPRQVRMQAPPLVWISDKTANFRMESRSTAEYLAGEYLGPHRKRKCAPTKKGGRHAVFLPPSPLRPVNNAACPHPTLCANNWLRTYRTSVIPARISLATNPFALKMRAIIS